MLREFTRVEADWSCPERQGAGILPLMRWKARKNIGSNTLINILLLDYVRIFPNRLKKKAAKIHSQKKSFKVCQWMS
jgi:hypothetical protein